MVTKTSFDQINTALATEQRRATSSPSNSRRGTRGAYSQMGDRAEHRLKTDRRSIGGTHHGTEGSVESRRRRLKMKLPVWIQGERGRRTITCCREAACLLGLNLFMKRRGLDLGDIAERAERAELMEDLSRGRDLFYWHIPCPWRRQRVGGREG
jgi:hypothetical protein